MKLSKELKIILFASLGALYLTGVITWLESPAYSLWLPTHSIVSLWFLILFGYMFNSHVTPAWKRGKRLKSGSLLTGTLIFLILTVPILFYMTNETIKTNVALAHTYVGLALLFVLIIHLRSKK